MEQTFLSKNLVREPSVNKPTETWRHAGLLIAMNLNVSHLEVSLLWHLLSWSVYRSVSVLKFTITLFIILLSIYYYCVVILSLTFKQCRVRFFIFFWNESCNLLFNTFEASIKSLRYTLTHAAPHVRTNHRIGARYSFLKIFHWLFSFALGKPNLNIQAKARRGENWREGESVCRVCEVLSHTVNLCVFGLTGVISSFAPLRPSAVCVCVCAKTLHQIMNVVYYT